MALSLASPAFNDGAPIPERYGYTEANVNPPLRIEGVPGGAETLALVVDDPDAVEPAGTVWDHWVVWNVPTGIGEVPEDWDAAAAGAVEGDNDFGERGYGGPNPPDMAHTYRFRVWAVDSRLDLPAGSGKDRLLEALDGHALDEAEFAGTYAP